MKQKNYELMHQLIEAHKLLEDILSFDDVPEEVREFVTHAVEALQEAELSVNNPRS